MLTMHDTVTAQSHGRREKREIKKRKKKSKIWRERSLHCWKKEISTRISKSISHSRPCSQRLHLLSENYELFFNSPITRESVWVGVLGSSFPVPLSDEGKKESNLKYPLYT